MISKLDVTIAIPVKNEAANLRTCLESIGNDFATNIVLIDSGSTDATCDIAREFNIPVINFEWNGAFPKKRNWFLRNHTPATEWVMFLDADEYITDEFKSELRKKLNHENVEGYLLSYTIYFLGKKLKGGYPLRKLALFKVASGEYEQINEDKWSTLDMEVHEHPVLKGKIGVIKKKIDHRDFRGISNYIVKHNEYSSWEAARYLEKNAVHLNWKQRLKYNLMRSAMIGPVYFFGSYIFFGGFLDGSRGLSFAILKASYFTQVYCKIAEKKRSLIARRN